MIGNNVLDIINDASKVYAKGGMPNLEKWADLIGGDAVKIVDYVKEEVYGP